MNILNRFKIKNYTMLLKYLLTGAVGFGFGSFFPFKFYPEVSFNAMGYANPNIIGLLIFGAIGGVSLGIMSRNTKKILYLALLGSIGIPIGFIMSFVFLYPFTVLILFFLSFLLPQSFLPFLMFFISFLFGGLITGIFYGIASKNIKKILCMSIAGGLGFAFGALFVFKISIIIYGISNMPPKSPLFWGLSAYIIFGTITGIFLALGMYFAEKTSISK
ncbi:MAG: hypothetical protein AEth_00237 [Candidatus Argoarchaeum ethanivorans]|uniref:Uncharacterized protein n=1 Tax=Candidatus Argoarchaeum ethanivorans TaxID=2608793 RepID=A0A8B3S4S7_9EURY|nr:MAG: hypothetical protein AEth_00237 [Candidatus Argoarchaeum ethanivorans]